MRIAALIDSISAELRLELLPALIIAALALPKARSCPLSNPSATMLHVSTACAFALTVSAILVTAVSVALRTADSLPAVHEPEFEIVLTAESASAVTAAVAAVCDAFTLEMEILAFSTLVASVVLSFTHAALMNRGRSSAAAATFAFRPDSADVTAAVIPSANDVTRGTMLVSTESVTARSSFVMLFSDKEMELGT